MEIPKPIKLYTSFLGVVAPSLQTAFAAKLFTTPIRHKTPSREYKMRDESEKTTLFIPEINKEIVVYQYGNSDKKVLLVHGWSGRGTQLAKMAEALIQQGYSTISFDAPAHGKSAGKSTIMTEFISSIQEIDRKFGPFDAAIGHSLGGLAILNSVRFGLKTKALVIVGTGDKISNILLAFTDLLGQKPELAPSIKSHFQKKYNTALPMEDYSGYLAAQHITTPTLLVHDTDDRDVPVNSSQHIHEHLKNSEIMITTGLGHRKILGNPEVIQRTVNFIIQNTNV